MGRPLCGCERDKGGVGSGVKGANARGWFAGTNAVHAPAMYSRRRKASARALERMFRLFLWIDGNAYLLAGLGKQSKKERKGEKHHGTMDI
jgi:hypothetical protein